MDRLKEYRLEIAGKADVVVFDGPTSQVFVLRATRDASRRRAFTLVGEAGIPVLQIRKDNGGSDVVEPGGAAISASRFQTRYRIELSDGELWLMRIPLFTERAVLKSSREGRGLKVEIYRKNLWRVFMESGANDAAILGSLSLICTERWNSSYGVGRWSALPMNGNGRVTAGPERVAAHEASGVLRGC